jgi:hypothetical protein
MDTYQRLYELLLQGGLLKVTKRFCIIYNQFSTKPIMAKPGTHILPIEALMAIDKYDLFSFATALIANTRTPKRGIPIAREAIEKIIFDSAPVLKDGAFTELKALVEENNQLRARVKKLEDLEQENKDLRAKLNAIVDILEPQ